MTKEEFIKKYCEQTGIEWEKLSKLRVAIICFCLDQRCDGWMLIPNDQASLEMYERLAVIFSLVV